MESFIITAAMTLLSKMTDLLQQVPVTFYLSIFVGLFTAIATLTGVWITNHATYKRLDLQLKHELQERDREIIRSKLEELYILFKQYTTLISSIYLSRTGVMAGRTGMKDALDIESKAAEESVCDFNRLEMLVDLYFPSLKPDYARVIQAREVASKIMLTHQSQYLSGGMDGKKLVQPFLKAQEDFSEEVKNFTRRLSDKALI
jgi:hypothetical protein